MSKQEFKSYRAEVKAVAGDAGVVEALVSVFGNVDLGGDRVVGGAFAKSLENWAAKGDPMPFIWSHEWDNPEAHIGYVEQAEERPEGLWVRAKLDVDRPFAEQVFHLLKSRRVTQFSFGYTVQDSRFVKDADGTEVRELLAVDVFEVGPTLLGMNPATQLLEAASAIRGAKAGRVLSAKNESILRAAHEAIGEVLAALPGLDEPKSKSVKAGEAIVVSDIDGTIANGEEPIQPVIDHLKARANDGYPVFIVSGRPDSRLAETRAWLEANDVPHSAIHLSDFPEGPNASRAFKVNKAEQLLKDYEILEWLENDADTRAALKDVGVNAISPESVKTAGKSAIEEVSTSVEEVESASRDTSASIIPEQVADLLIRTRYSEE